MRKGRIAVSHPMYNVCYQAFQRCLNPNSKSYASYGERGIRVCDEWTEDPLLFAEYIMTLDNYESRKELKLTLDRKDNNKGYEPGNLRWATKEQQNQNRLKGWTHKNKPQTEFEAIINGIKRRT